MVRPASVALPPTLPPTGEQKAHDRGSIWDLITALLFGGNCSLWPSNLAFTPVCGPVTRAPAQIRPGRGSNLTGRALTAPEQPGREPIAAVMDAESHVTTYSGGSWWGMWLASPLGHCAGGLSLGCTEVQAAGNLGLPTSPEGTGPDWSGVARTTSPATGKGGHSSELCGGGEGGTAPGAANSTAHGQALWGCPSLILQGIPPRHNPWHLAPQL